MDVAMNATNVATNVTMNGAHALAPRRRFAVVAVTTPQFMPGILCDEAATHRRAD
jgi:hypothetical protein